MIFLLIVFFIGAAWFDVPALIRKRYFREFAVYSLFLLSAFILSFLYIIGVKIPSPIDGIEYLIRDLLHLSY